jgi:hypothetical protein
MAAKIVSTPGITQRIRTGWRLGLRLRDGFVCIGTLVIVAQIGVIGLLAYRAATAVVPSTSMLRRTLGLEQQGPPIVIGQQAWIRHVTADLNPTPKYSLQNRRLWAFQPVTITGMTPDHEWVSVTSTYANGQRVSGWVLTTRVQTVNPGADAVPEPGWVTVVGQRGAVLRTGPDLNADGWGAAPKGQTLRKLARLKPEGIGSDLKDFLYVENAGPAGRRGGAWVFEPDVAPASGSGGR